MAKQSDKGFGISPDIIVIGGVATLAYLGVLNPLLKWVGIKKDDDTKQQEQTAAQAILTTKQQLIKAGVKQFRTDAYLSNVADAIFQALRFSSVSDDYNKAVYQLCTPQNSLDVLRLIEIFGSRQECWFGVICKSGNLNKWIASNLSKAQIAAVNANYASKSIQYRW